MTNAKQELISVLKNVVSNDRPYLDVKVKCAYIYKYNYDGEIKPILLKVAYTETEWENFLKELDFTYDSG